MNVQLSSIYTDNGMTLAKDILQYPTEFTNAQRCRAYRYTYMFANRDRSVNPRMIKTAIIGFFDALIRGEPIDLESVQELADTLHTFSPEDGALLLERVREYTRSRELKKSVHNKKSNKEIPLPVSRTVYDDSQNVHNTKINESMCVAIKSICESVKEMYASQIEKYTRERLSPLEAESRVLDDCGKYLTVDHPTHAKLIRTSMDYFRLSVATFTDEHISLAKLFICLYMYIVNSRSRVDLELRLMEEFESMEGYCNSGHASRLVNVLQGFTEDERLIIRVSSRDQCKAVVTAFVQTVLTECEDEAVIDGLVTLSPVFVAFVRNAISKEWKKWAREYGEEFDALVPEVLYDYLRIELE
jgi:hypothetical protein